MIRYTFALVFSLALVAGVRAADLPTGTWTINVDGKKGELVIKEVAKNGGVTGKLFGTDFIGHWNGKAFTINPPLLETYEGYLVSEPAEKGKTKYTLTGIRTEASFLQFNVPPPPTKTGWYAQITANTPVPMVVGEIKAEIRGVLVEDGAKVYVSVKRKDTFGNVEETRIYVWKSEGEWKLLQHTLKPMYGKEIVVTAKLAQLPKGSMTSIPEGALYFLGKFEPKLANVPKE